MPYPYETLQVTDNTLYSSHPQGKGHTHGGKLVTWYRESPLHPTLDDIQDVWRGVVDIATFTVDSIAVEFAHDATYGVDSYAAGKTATHEYIILNYWIAGLPQYQTFAYRLLGSTGAWTEKNIPAPPAGNPWGFHTCVGRNGIICFGYQTVSKELGIVTTDDLGDTFTYHTVYASGVNDNNVEISMLFDSENDIYVGFIRSDEPTGTPAKFWKSSDLITYTTTDMAVTFENKHVMYPIVKVGTKYFSAAIERVAATTTQGVYIMEAEASDAITNGWAAWGYELQHNITSFNGIPNGTGVHGLVYDSGNLYLIYCIEPAMNNVNVFVDRIALFFGVMTIDDGTTRDEIPYYDDYTLGDTGGVVLSDGVDHYRVGLVDSGGVAVVDNGTIRKQLEKL